MLTLQSAQKKSDNDMPIKNSKTENNIFEHFKKMQARGDFIDQSKNSLSVSHGLTSADYLRRLSSGMISSSQQSSGQTFQTKKKDSDKTQKFLSFKKKNRILKKDQVRKTNIQVTFNFHNVNRLIKIVDSMHLNTFQKTTIWKRKAL